MFAVKSRAKILRGVLSILLTLLVPSCRFIDPSIDGEVAPGYVVPWVPYPCKEETHSPTTAEDDDIEMQMLTDKQPWHLDNLIDVALRNNPDTRVTWQHARAAAFGWRSSQSTLYPTINLSEQLLYQKITGVGGAGVGAASALAIDDDGTNNQDIVVAGGGGRGGINGVGGSRENGWLISTLSFSYLMLDFGGRAGAIEAAREALFNANWTHNREIQTVILQVLTAYYQHLEANALVAARELDLKEAKENLESAQGQFDAGVVTIVDVLQAKSAYVNIQFQLEQLHGQSRTTLGRLATAMGMPAQAHFEVVPLPEDLPVEEVHKDIDELIETAKRERPDLAAAEAIWKQEEANVQVVRSSGLPVLSANGIVQDTKNIRDSTFNSRYYSGSILLNIPLFAGFYYVNQTRMAKANALAAYEEWKSRENNALLEVVMSYADFMTAAKQMTFANENYAYASQAYEAALANYRFGVSTILDVLTAEASLSNARAQKIQSRTFWIISLTNIAYATGTL